MSLTFEEWETLWLYAMGLVILTSSTVSPTVNFLAHTSGERDVTALFNRLIYKGVINVHRPGWLNGAACGWRVEITNVGWRALDARPSRTRTEDKSDE